MSIHPLKELAGELADSGVPEKVTLAYMMAAYLIAVETQGKDIPAVIVIPDGEGNIGSAGLDGDVSDTLALLLHAVCATAISALGLDLHTVQGLLREAWGEKQSGMGAAGRHARRRPSGHSRRRGKR